MEKHVTKCPNCGSDAYYRYGKTKNKKLRRLCLVCDRQYVVEKSLKEESARPNCPVCLEPMHVYQRQETLTRYRCRNYPACRKFVKVFH
jgi:ssDNA-binding Zn-finger/Zn-ribbon topoisomerase 1